MAEIDIVSFDLKKIIGENSGNSSAHNARVAEELKNISIDTKHISILDIKIKSV